MNSTETAPANSTGTVRPLGETSPRRALTKKLRTAKTKTLITTLLISVILLGIGYAQEKGPVVLQEAWYNMYLADQKIGYVTFKIEKTEYQKKECYKFSNEMVMKIAQDEKNTIELKKLSASFVDMDFRPIYIMDNELEQGQTKACSATVTDDEITLKSTLNNEKPEITKLKNEAGLTFGVDGFILKAQGLLKVGTATSAKSISTSKKRIVSETIKILKAEKIKVNKEEVDTLYAENWSDDTPEEIMQINFDPDGCPVLVKASGMEMRRTNQKKAQSMKKAADIASMISIKTNAQMTADINILARLQLVMTFKKPYDNVIITNDYQVVSQDKDKYKIILKAISGDVAGPLQLPVAEAAVKSYLTPSKYVLSQDETVLTQAQAILKDEKDALQAARLICEWMFNTIKFENNSKDKTAKETLRDKAGDSDERTALFAALCRASGLPARQVSGFCFNGSVFFVHDWNEVYIGKWIPVDILLKLVGIPAGYIKLGENEKDEKGRDTATSKITQIMGNVTIEIASALDKDNKSIDLSGKKN